MWRHARKSRKTQARRKVRTRLAQVFPCTIMIYIYIFIYIFFIRYILYIHTLIHCMYIDFIIKAFLWICQSSSSKTDKLSCISRASCAQAPRKQKNAFGWSKEGDPRTDDHFLGKKARKIPEEFVHTTEEKRQTTHCSEGKARESKECQVP